MCVEVKFNVEIDEKDYEELVRMVDHHIDWLLDLSSNPEIKTVYGATTSIIKKGE